MEPKQYNLSTDTSSRIICISNIWTMTSVSLIEVIENISVVCLKVCRDAKAVSLFGSVGVESLGHVT